MPSSKGFMNKMRRGMNGSPASMKKSSFYKKRNKKLDEQNDEIEKINSEPNMTHASPTSVRNFDQVFSARNSPYENSSTQTNVLNLYRTTSSTTIPFYPVSSTLSSETPVTSNCKSARRRHSLESSLSPPPLRCLESSPKLVSLDPRADETDLSFSLPTENKSLLVPFLELMVGPTIRNHLSLVQPDNYVFDKHAGVVLNGSKRSSRRILEKQIQTSLHPHHTIKLPKYGENHLQKQDMDECTDSTILEGSITTYSTEASGSESGSYSEKPHQTYLFSMKDPQKSCLVELTLYHKISFEEATNCLQNANFDGAIHAFRSIMHHCIEETGDDHPLLGLVFYNLSVVHVWKGEHRKACELMMKALKYQRTCVQKLKDNDKAKETSDDQMASNILLNYIFQSGIIQCLLLDFSGSIASFEEALQLAHKIHGQNHAYSAIINNCIGYVQFEQGEYMAAHSTFEIALHIERSRMRACNSVEKLLNVASILGNISICFWKRNMWNDAMDTLEEVLMVQGSVLGDDHKTVLCTKCHLSSITQVRKKTSKSSGNQNVTLNNYLLNKTSLEENILEDTSPLLGRSKRKTLKSKNSTHKDLIVLGSLKHEIDTLHRVHRTIDTQKAASSDFFMDVRDDSEGSGMENKRYGSIPVDLDDWKVVDAEFYLKEIHDRVSFLVANGQISDALELFECVLRSFKEKYGTEHYLLAQTLYNMGVVHMHGKEYRVALSLFKQSSSIFSKAYSADHPNASISKIKAGIALYALQEYKNALTTFVEKLNIERENSSSSPSIIAQILNNIGVIHYEQGEFILASETFQEALDIQRTELVVNGNRSPLVNIAIADILGNVGFMFVKRKLFGEAILAFEEALGLYRDIQEHESRNLNETLQNLAYTLAHANSSSDDQSIEKMIDVYEEMLHG